MRSRAAAALSPRQMAFDFLVVFFRTVFSVPALGSKCRGSGLCPWGATGSLPLVRQEGKRNASTAVQTRRCSGHAGPPGARPWSMSCRQCLAVGGKLNPLLIEASRGGCLFHLRMEMNIASRDERHFALPVAVTSLLHRDRMLTLGNFQIRGSVAGKVSIHFNVSSVRN